MTSPDLPTEGTPYPLSYTHYARVAVLLLAGEVQARVVASGEQFVIEVRQPHQRVYWANAEQSPGSAPVLMPWGWTALSLETGRTEHGRSHISPDACPEDVALAIALMYDTPQDGPTL